MTRAARYNAARCLLILLFALSAQAAARRVLYLTHSAGFRHGSIEVSRDVLRELGQRSGKYEVFATEDLGYLSAERLREFDAVFFFTSGELPISEAQKQALLDFVRSGKGFGGAHSATDTFYTWAEYGEMIGAYFDGHPWVHEAAVDVEDTSHPVARGAANSFRILEEFYQFRNFSRDRVRVLMTLDARTIDLQAPGVNRTDRDFALAWVRPYGAGRVFYTALGHFDDTWKDARFQRMLDGALLWLTGEAQGDSVPRNSRPLVSAVQSGDEGTDSIVAPGAVITIRGRGLTTGSTTIFEGTSLPLRLAGTEVLINGNAIPLLSVSPERVQAQAPFTIGTGRAELNVVSGAISKGDSHQLIVRPAAPVILAVGGERRGGGTISIYATGLGQVQPPVAVGVRAPLDRLVRTEAEVAVLVGETRVAPAFAGLAPGLIALYQVNVALPEGIGARAPLVLEAAGERSPIHILDPGQ